MAACLDSDFLPRPIWDIGPKMQLDIEGGVELAEFQIANLEVLDAVIDLDIKMDNPVVEVTRFCGKWLMYAFGFRADCVNPKEELARRVVEEFDLVAEEPSDYVNTETRTVVDVLHEGAELAKSVEKVEKRQRVRKGCRSKFACSLAKLAYNKFGARPPSQANMLTTRRWLQKQLEADEYKDLRTVDKNTAIDRALFLSFVTSQEFQEMRVLFDTKMMQGRTLCQISGVA
jgi:hypothetical protein